MSLLNRLGFSTGLLTDEKIQENCPVPVCGVMWLWSYDTATLLPPSLPLPAPPRFQPDRPPEFILSTRLFVHASTLRRCCPFPAERLPQPQLFPRPPLNSSITSMSESQPSLPPQVLVATWTVAENAHRPPPGPGFLEELVEPSLISSEPLILGRQE